MSKKVEVAEWLIQNREPLQKLIESLYRPAHHLFPPAMHEIYLQQYEAGVVRILREEAAKDKSLDLSPEELVVLIDENSVNRACKSLLIQPG